MKLISFEQLDVALDLMPSNSFTTQDFIDVFEKVCPLEYSQVVAAYGVGGKNSGSHYSAKAHIGKSLSNYKGQKSLRFVSYIHAHPEWGNPVIALWSLLSADDVLEADLL